MLVSGITNQPITKRSDRTINDVIEANWTIPDPPKAQVGFGEYWELSENNSTIMTWELPVGIQLVGVSGKKYDYAIKNQIEIMVRNPEQIGYPDDLEKMVFHVEQIITDHVQQGVVEHGYHSMVLTGHQYIRNPEISDKALCIIFVDMNVRLTHI